MKKTITFFIALILLSASLTLLCSAQGFGSHATLCPTCDTAGDLDGNGELNTDDATRLLFYTMCPERYSLSAHPDHTKKDCEDCKRAADMDQNGKLDSDDAVYLLYHTLAQERFPLPGCTYEGTLAVGYSRIDITPEETMDIYGSTANRVHDPLMMTCTALDDGEHTALLFSLDLRSISVDFTQKMMDLAEEKFGIPGEQMLFNITHTHSTPAITNNTAAGGRWRQKILNQLPIVIQAALDDLDEVEAAYAGTGYTEGITFVRRYLCADGSYVMNPSASDKPVAHETEADNQMRTLRIDRKHKKDVLMVNYQTHYGSATGLYPGKYSADFVHVFREEAEKKWDCHFVYHSGASANLNFVSALPGERKYQDFIQATKKGLMPVAEGCIAGEKEVSVGDLCFAFNRYTAPVYQDTEEDIANAKIVNSSGLSTDSKEYKALAQSYGFAGYRQVQGIITRSKLGETLDVPFYAISFGEIGFVSSPYEMFDTNGMQVRDGSPFEMTFVCSYTNGGFGYVPSSYAFPHGGYEVFVSRFCETTGDDFAEEMIRLLNECKKQN